MAQAATPIAATNGMTAAHRLAPEGGIARIATVAAYGTDAVVRRAPALQATPVARAACVALHPGDALALGLSHGAQARVSDGSAEVVLPVEISTAVPHGAAWIESGLAATRALKPCGASLTISKV
jgi:NADH-quinone oxidoreductase subunit G